MPQQERVNIAVFIDFDNIEIGVRTTLGEHFDIGTVLEALKERGEIVAKIAYADWTRAGEYSRALTQHAIRLVQRNLTPGGDKNGADINLALDALEMAFTHPHINAYVIVGGDSDFLSLVEKLKQYDKKVFVVGGRAFTSVILQRNCHEFVAYENLTRKPVSRGGRPDAKGAALAPVAQAFPIVRRALKILADREVTPQTGLLKSTLLQLDSTFSERNYGASSFLDFAEKLAQAGLVQLKHAGRSVTVELNPGFADDGEAASPIEPRDVSPEAFKAEIPTPIGSTTEGVKAAGQLFSSAASARWPMYLRNAKQILRAGGFDERRYGFGGLMDLLRACQREGLIRLERDRRGGLRVFQGPAFVRAGVARLQPVDVQPAEEPIDEKLENVEPVDAQPVAGEAVSVTDANILDDAEVIDETDAPLVSVVDTTAELLGRATSKRPRPRATATRKPAPRKPGAARRTSRSRKAASSASDEKED